MHTETFIIRWKVSKQKIEDSIPLWHFQNVIPVGRNKMLGLMPQNISVLFQYDRLKIAWQQYMIDCTTKNGTMHITLLIWNQYRCTFYRTNTSATAVMATVLTWDLLPSPSRWKARWHYHSCCFIQLRDFNNKWGRPTDVEYWPEEYCWMCQVLQFRSCAQIFAYDDHVLKTTRDAREHVGYPQTLFCTWSLSLTLQSNLMS